MEHNEEEEICSIYPVCSPSKLIVTFYYLEVMFLHMYIGMHLR